MFNHYLTTVTFYFARYFNGKFVIYREFRDRMRVFAQFYTAQEYEQFLTNLERERELRLRLSELYRYREHGITRHEECAHFEQVLAQTQGQNDAVDHWHEKKSVSMCIHISINFFHIAMVIEIFFGWYTFCFILYCVILGISTRISKYIL